MGLVNPKTTFSNLIRAKQWINTATDAFPTSPQTGQMFIDTANNRLYVWDTGAWYYASLITTTTTSTSTTTTTTSTTTSTSTSTSSSTSTTTTSTSTTTTL